MKLRSLALVAALVGTSSGVGRADVLPPGEKGVRNSLFVEGKLPPGKGLVIGNTFFGATRAPTGTKVDVSWHPLSGPMRLFLLDAAELAKVPEGGKIDHARELKALAEKGVRCSDEFSGTRTIPETEPADEVRLVFQVEATATTCAAKLVRTEYYAKDGKAVAGPDGGSAPPAATSAAPSKAGADDAKPPPAAETPPRSGCAGCGLASGSDSPIAPALGVAFAALAILRRKKARF